MTDFYGKMKADRAARLANASDGPRPKYRVLEAGMVKQSDREHAAAVASFVCTGDEAYKLAGHGDFKYFDLDRNRRVGVVLYKGLEVALLFKRRVVELEPGPADPVPQCELKDPADAWIQVDLLDIDDVEKKKGITERLQRALSQVSRLQMLWQEEETKRKYLEGQLQKMAPDREALKGLAEKVALLELEKKATASELDGLRKEIREQKEARKNDKLDLVRQMFPVFNTVWLAGLHRVGDQLYGMVKVQLTEALAKVGITFIEPVVGDKFDPLQHHAIHATAFAPGSREIDTVLKVHRVGWCFGGGVVEAAEVLVGVEQKLEESVPQEGVGGNGSTV